MSSVCCQAIILTSTGLVLSGPFNFREMLFIETAISSVAFEKILYKIGATCLSNQCVKQLMWTSTSHLVTCNTNNFPRRKRSLWTRLPYQPYGFTNWMHGHRANYQYVNPNAHSTLHTQLQTESHWWARGHSQPNISKACDSSCK